MQLYNMCAEVLEIRSSTNWAGPRKSSRHDGRANDSSLSIAKSRGLSVCVGLGSVGSSLGVQWGF